MNYKVNDEINIQIHFIGQPLHVENLFGKALKIFIFNT